MTPTARLCLTGTGIFGLLALFATATAAGAATYVYEAEAQRLLIAAPEAVQCATSAGGFLTLRSHGVVHSSDPASPHFLPALAGLRGDSLREIVVSATPGLQIGPFAGQRLTLKATDSVELVDVVLLADSLSVSASGITVSGEIRVPGQAVAAAATRGGDIRLLGESIRLEPSAHLDSSGSAGGGLILLGGDYLGGNGVPTATHTHVESGARIHADALHDGNGGRVIVWADALTAFHGHVSARAGAQGGDGGFIEVSGKAQLDFAGTADTAAPKGKAGTLLLDPANITIQSMSPDINGDTTTGDNFTSADALDNAATDFPGASSVITDGALEAVLQSGNVTLAATNNIHVASVVNLNAIGTTPRTLTLHAGNNVAVFGGGGFSAAGATTLLNLMVIADADNNGSGAFFTQGAIQTNGGDIQVVAANNLGVSGGSGVISAASVYLHADISTGGGDVEVSGLAQAGQPDVHVVGNTDIATGGGNLTLTGDRLRIDASTSLAGSGPLVLQPLSASTAMLIGGAGSAATDFLTSAELAEIDNGFSSITLGRSDSSGTLTVHSSGASLADPLLLRAPAGAITLNGLLSTTDGAGVTLQSAGTTTVASSGGITAAGPVAFAGSGPVSLAGPVTSSGAAISVAGPVTSSGSLAAFSAASTVTLNDAVNINGAGAGSLPVSGNLVLGPAASLNFTINGTAPSQRDQLTVTGGVSLAGNLVPSFGYTPQLGDLLPVIGNDASDPIVGAFANQAAGSALIAGSTRLVLRHTLVDGNDVGFLASNQHTLNYTAGANGTLSGSASQTVNVGDAGSAVTALPASGYRFLQWSDGAVLNPRTDSNVMADIAVTAQFANQVPAITAVADQPVLEDSGTTSLTVQVADLESPAASLVLTAVSSQPGLLPHPPVMAGASAGERVLGLTPAADQNGSATVTLSLADAAGSSVQDNFTVTVTAVNDAPQLSLGTVNPHPAATSGPQSQANFASVVLGPAEEPTTQAVDDLLLQATDANGVLSAIDIGNDGTLSYTLTGVGGIASVVAQLRDNGGTASGGVNLSAAQGFDIVVARGADLQVAKSNQRSAVQPGEQLVYAVVAANAGPNAVSGATLNDPLPATLGSASWVCVPAQSTATCPTPAAGSGNLAASIDLGVNQHLRFNVMATVTAALGQTISNTASIVAPGNTTPLNTGNDSNTDSDPVLAASIHRDGFEAAPTAALTVPAAAEALR